VTRETFLPYALPSIGEEEIAEVVEKRDDYPISSDS
jgi:hypothetical protein